MKCARCSEEGKRSKVYVGASSSTLMMGEAFFDEEGRWHSHDPNTRATQYSCSEGHEWTEGRRDKCPSCDYGSG